jgi:hypothetical protein
VQTIWVAQLNISAATAHKLSTQHGLDADEVRDEIQCVEYLSGVLDDDPERGQRAILRVRIRNVWHLVVLYPVEHPMGDVWNLGSAYPD